MKAALLALLVCSAGCKKTQQKIELGSGSAGLTGGSAASGSAGSGSGSAAGSAGSAGLGSSGSAADAGSAGSAGAGGAAAGAAGSAATVAGCDCSKLGAPGTGSGATGGNAGAAATGGSSVATAGSAGPGSASGASAAAASCPCAGAAAVKPFPKLADKQYLAFAEQAGVDIDFSVENHPELNAIHDGVLVTEATAPAPQPDGHIWVKHGAAVGHAASKYLADMHHLALSPDAQWAIVHPELECVDFCHDAVWLAHGLGGDRWRIFDNAVALHVAWHPKMTHVAVGGDGELAVVSLPDGKQLYKVEGKMAPVFAPNGDLYVRDTKYGVLTFDLATGKTKKVGQGKVEKEEEGVNTFPEPVRFGPTGAWVDPIQ